MSPMCRNLRIAVCALVCAATARPSAGGEHRLVDAVRNGDRHGVERLLRQRVDVNGTGPDGSTALLLAAERNDRTMAEALLRAGARADAANDYGITPMWMACGNASAPMARALLNAGASAKTTLPSGETLLMTAARTGDVEVVRMLAAKGADVNAQESIRGQTALMWAVSEHHAGVVQALVELGAAVSARTRSGFSPLLFAAREGEVDIARFLLARGASVDDSDNAGASVLAVATVRGHTELAKLLLNAGARPDGFADKLGFTPLHFASGTWETSFTNDYPDAPGEWQALSGIQDRERKLSLIEVLLEHGANPNARLVKSPPQYGILTIGERVIGGGTPFFLASIAADLEVMRLLLAHGADPALEATGQNTPLLVAAGNANKDDDMMSVPESRRLEAITFLTGLGADVHQVDVKGYNILHAATVAGYETVVKSLIASGYPLNVKTRSGRTALALADRGDSGVYFSRPRVAEILRAAGAVSEGAVVVER